MRRQGMAYPTARSPYSTLKLNGWRCYRVYLPLHFRGLQQTAIDLLNVKPQISAALILRYNLNDLPAYDNDDMLPRLTPIKDVADLLGVSNGTISGWCRAGERKAWALVRTKYVPQLTSWTSDPRTPLFGYPVIYAPRVIDRLYVLAMHGVETRTQRRRDDAARAERHRHQHEVDQWIKDCIAAEWRLALARGETFTLTAAELDRLIKTLTSRRKVTV
jgi:hypothetical protein